MHVQHLVQLAKLQTARHTELLNEHLCGHQTILSLSDGRLYAYKVELKNSLAQFSCSRYSKCIKPMC